MDYWKLTNNPLLLLIILSNFLFSSPLSQERYVDSSKKFSISILKVELLDYFFIQKSLRLAFLNACAINILILWLL